MNVVEFKIRVDLDNGRVTECFPAEDIDRVWLPPEGYELVPKTPPPPPTKWQRFVDGIEQLFCVIEDRALPLICAPFVVLLLIIFIKIAARL
jgi:hypothetical protein